MNGEPRRGRAVVLGTISFALAVLCGAILSLQIWLRPLGVLFGLLALGFLISLSTWIVARKRVERTMAGSVAFLSVMIWGGLASGTLVGQGLLHQMRASADGTIDSTFFRLRMEAHPLPVDLIEAGETDRVVSYVTPLGEGRFLVKLAAQINWAGHDEIEGVGALRGVLAVIRVEDGELSLEETVELETVRLIRGATWDPVTNELFLAHIDLEDGCAALAVERIRVGFEPFRAGDKERLFTSEPCIVDRPLPLHQAGGAITLDPYAGILVSVGDFGLGPSYDPGSPMVERVRPLGENRPPEMIPPAMKGTIVSIERESGSSRIVASGFRNPQGILVHPETGAIWATDHGPRGGDRLNLIAEGEDYGWPDASLGIPYGPPHPEAQWSPSEWTLGLEGFGGPQYGWSPGVAPTALAVFPRGTGTPSLSVPDLVVGALADQSLRWLWLDGDRVLIDERIPIHRRVRDVAVDDSGQLVLTTDDGELILLWPDG